MKVILIVVRDDATVRTVSMNRVTDEEVTRITNALPDDIKQRAEVQVLR